MANRESTSSAERYGDITDVSGIRVGHTDNPTARTGCTVVLCPDEGAVAGVDVRGGAPGTRETDLLNPENLVERVHAILLTGGSAFGLDAACGVVRFLEERGVGFETPVARVPIVPAAVLFDLAVGDPKVRPDAAMGYRACELAAGGPLAQGNVGAGAGATVGKILGPDFASPGGLASASTVVGDVVVGVLVVVNAFGDIVDPDSGQILAGARSPEGPGWFDTNRAVTGLGGSGRESTLPNPFLGIENTTLAVVATDAALTKAQCRRVAAMAQDGFARAIRPAHTMYDGDTVFALSAGSRSADVSMVGVTAAELLSRAIAGVTRMVPGA